MPHAPPPTASDDASEHPVVARLKRDVTLRQGVQQGAAWIGGARLAAQGWQFAVSLITARLLLPAQFGEAAVVLALCAFAQLFTDLGLAAAIVQAKRVTEELLSSAFWLNLATGVALTAFVCALAVPISRLYGEPALTGLLIAASLNFVLACGAVQTAVLERAFQFRRLAVLETATSVLGTATVPVAALAGAGTVSLVLGPLVTTATLSLGLWLLVGWRPHRGPDRAAIAQLWRFSRGLVGFNAVNYWSRNLDTLLLGRFASTAAVGQYNRAFTLTMMPVQQMSVVLGRAMFPALARMSDERRRLGKAWARGLAAAGSLTMPVTLTLAATAPALVHVLYGPRWAGMVDVLQLLALSTVPQIVGASTGSVFRAADRTGLLFRLGLLSSGLSVVAILAGLPWGATGVAAALLVKSWLALPIVLLPLAKITNLRRREVLLPCVAFGWPSLALVVGELAVRFAAPADASPYVVLPAQLAAGVALWLLVAWRTKATALTLVSHRLQGLRARRARAAA